MDRLTATHIAQHHAALWGVEIREVPDWVIDAMSDCHDKGYEEGEEDQKELQDAD